MSTRQHNAMFLLFAEGLEHRNPRKTMGVSEIAAPVPGILPHGRLLKWTEPVKAYSRGNVVTLVLTRVDNFDSGSNAFAASLAFIRTGIGWPEGKAGAATEAGTTKLLVSLHSYV